MKRIIGLMLVLVMTTSAGISLAEAERIQEIHDEYAKLLVGQWQADDGEAQITIEMQDIFFSASGEAFLRQGKNRFPRFLINAEKNTICLIDESSGTPTHEFYNRCNEIYEDTNEVSSPSDGYSFQQIFEKSIQSVVWLQSPNGGGTGFYVDENTILTNNHVIDEVEWLTATTADGLVYEVKQILGRSESPDLALLHIDKPGIPLPLNTHGISAGEPICIMGAPMGLYPSISNGIVMKSSHQDGGVNYILSNVHSIGGNSGGPAFNRYGEVIGVVVGVMADGPNAIDMIIHIDQMKDINIQNRGKINSYDEFMDELNALDEEKYQIVPLKDAQPGTLVKFGAYEQDADLANGKEDILWLVKERNGDELMLLSLYCLDTMPYNEEPRAVTWESSTIRAYLNNEFYAAAFTKEEQNKILTKTVVNRDNPVHGTPGGADTKDKVYLLSLEEVQKYWNIPENEERFYDGLYGQATEYCMTRPIWLEIDGVNRCWWWLRSSGGSEDLACEVGSKGYLSFNGGLVSNADHAIRPVIHVSAK